MTFSEENNFPTIRINCAYILQMRKDSSIYVSLGNNNEKCGSLIPIPYAYIFTMLQEQSILTIRIQANYLYKDLQTFLFIFQQRNSFFTDVYLCMYSIHILMYVYIYFYNNTRAKYTHNAYLPYLYNDLQTFLYIFKQRNSFYHGQMNHYSEPGHSHPLQIIKKNF